MSSINLFIQVPTDDKGFLGRLCNNPECRKYFKIHKENIKAKMYCPYCGNMFPNDELWTTHQKDYILASAREKAQEYIADEVNKMFKNFAKNASTKYVKWQFKPAKVISKSVKPSYKEYDVDSEIICPRCNVSFQVDGIFGFCPGCRSENLLIYDTSFELIKQEIKGSVNPERSLRHAYSDLVSTFESFCRRKARDITSERVRFQNISETRTFFKKQLNVDIFKNIEENEQDLIRRIFQKRHLFEHDEGIINEKYIRKVPQEAHLLGTKAKLDLDELCLGSLILRRVLDNLNIKQSP